ncbi:uncharacterized protein [Drosophila takahashii]|uniref:uncharacterized protein n=1 Tax=Drosophila takahashii TaxID=29030 RepID=UPI00389937D7
MRLLALHIALLYLFHSEICAFSNHFAELESWFDKNVKGRQDAETTDTIIMLCLIKVKKLRRAQNTDTANTNTENIERQPEMNFENTDNINSANRETQPEINLGTSFNNTNAVENYIILPTIKMPNITVIIVEEELSQVARTGFGGENDLAKIIGQFKDCLKKKLEVLAEIKE